MNTLSPSAIQEMCGPQGLGPYIEPAAGPRLDPSADPVHAAVLRWGRSEAKRQLAKTTNTRLDPTEYTEYQKARRGLFKLVLDYEASRGRS